MQMAGRFLLDTNVVIALFGGDTSVTQHIAQAEETLVSSTVLGELYYGAYSSTQVMHNLARLDSFARTIAVVQSDVGTSRHYGETKSILRRKGRPFPRMTCGLRQWHCSTTSRWSRETSISTGSTDSRPNAGNSAPATSPPFQNHRATARCRRPV